MRQTPVKQLRSYVVMTPSYSTGSGALNKNSDEGDRGMRYEGNRGEDTAGGGMDIGRKQLQKQ